MSTNDEQMRALIAEQAAEWFVVNDAGELDARESAALVAWLQASPLHVEEFLRIAGVAHDMRLACADPWHSSRAVLDRARAVNDDPVPSFWSRMLDAAREVPARRWQPAAVAVAACGVAAVALLLSRSLSPVAPLPAPERITAWHFMTRHGEQQTQRLADNSVLHLNTDTDVTVRYGGKDRLVTIAFGEAAFEVTHETGRPFRVLAGAAEIRDLGTEFDVRLKDRSTLVTVVEGRVAVEPSPAIAAQSANRDQPVAVGAGQQITVAAGAWPATPVAVDAARVTAWQHRKIVFDGEPLAQVIAEVNRYAPKPIEITTPALNNLEISGVFLVDDSSAFLAFLRSLEGVQVDETASRVRVSQR